METGIQAVPRQGPKVDTANWMRDAAALRNYVKPMSLCQFPLPGSHDAGSYGKINARSRTQRASIAEQLELGVRYFDFRLIVDEFVYFSHHGSDHSRDNPYTAKVLDPNTNYLFKQIREFCDSHVGEIVILNFGDFVLHWNQTYYAKDYWKELIACIKRDFGSLLLPPPVAAIPTYGECIASEHRVIVIFSDDGESSLQDPEIWPRSAWWRDHYSEYAFLPSRSWETLRDYTLEDQQNYLTPPPGSDHRDPNKFWVTQAVLKYTNMTLPDGDHSQNFTGAGYLNPVFVNAFVTWWTKGIAVPVGENTKTKAVAVPNVLLMDFVGLYERFAVNCFDLLCSPYP